MDSDAISKIAQNVAAKKFRLIDLADSHTLQQFVYYIENLPSDPSQFPTVKKLLVGYGLPAMIYLANFYAGLSAQTCMDNEIELQTFAIISYEMMEGKVIDELDFIFRHGLLKEKYKAVKKSVEEQQFIKDVSQLSKKKKSVAEGVISAGELEQYYQFLMKKDQWTPLQRKALHKYYLTSEAHSPNQPSSDPKQGNYAIEPAAIVEENIVEPVNLSLNEEESIMNEEESIKNEEESIKNEEESIVEENNIVEKNSKIGPREESGADSFQSERKNEPKLSRKMNESTEATLTLEKDRRKDLLCCRQFFYDKEEIKDSENEEIIFRDFEFPFHKSEAATIKSLICSFLNGDGGILFLGMEKLKDGRKIVRGSEFSEATKEDVLKAFRVLSQEIEPDIITHKMYRVEFVPIRDSHSSRFVPGYFVCKLNIRHGVRDEIYSYHQNSMDIFPFLNHREIITKEGRALLKELKSRIKNPPPPPLPKHEGPCLAPDLGEQIHQRDTSSKKASMKERSRPTDITYQSKPSWPQSPPLPVAPSPAPLRQQVSITTEQNAFLSRQFAEDSDSQGMAARKKQASTRSVEGYFFVSGINESQIAPVLEKKNLLHQVKIDSTRQNKFIIMAFSEDVLASLRKIFAKIRDKYGSKILIHEIALSIEVGSIRKAIELLEPTKIKLDITGNVITFKFFKESLHAFLLLQKVMSVRFLS